MRVLHVCPTYFGPRSVLGGGERYSYGLSKAMSRATPTTLVTFGDEAFQRRDDDLTIRCYRRWSYVKGRRHNPFSPAFLKDVFAADIVHCHQFHTVATDIATLGSVLGRKKLFITDLAGGADFSFSGRLPLWRAARAFLLISDYNRRLFEGFSVAKRVIYGGVDEKHFCPVNQTRSNRILFVGRLLEHKGIHLLIDAIEPDMPLDVVGQIADNAYAKHLGHLAAGKQVTFHYDLPEDSLLELYRMAAIVAIPSLVDGGYTTALEAMACGAPVVATSVGSMPELVADGVTGFLSSADDLQTFRRRLRQLLDDRPLAAKMGGAGRDRVEAMFTWERVVERCLHEYTA